MNEKFKVFGLGSMIIMIITIFFLYVFFGYIAKLIPRSTSQEMTILVIVGVIMLVTGRQIVIQVEKAKIKTRFILNLIWIVAFIISTIIFLWIVLTM